jgi:3-hydroxyisobutyrate dehydrogenase-like beta-hydroxyacid dehydrogenase
MKATESGMRIGVLGLGLMGSALADALLASGLDLTVWNRSPEKTERFRAAGANVAATVVDAARRSNVLVVCLADHAATRQSVLTDDVGHALKGKTLVELSSITAGDVTALGQWTAASGARLLCGSIFVYPDDIRARHGTIIYAGSRQAFDEHHEALLAMGGNPVFVAEDALARIWVARAYAYILFPMLVGFVHGAAVCQRSGVSVEVFCRDLILPLLKGTALPGMIDRLAVASSSRNYDRNVQATLDIWNDSLSATIRDLDGIRFNTGLLRAVKDALDRAAARGFGKKDLASIFETLIEEQIKA